MEGESFERQKIRRNIYQELLKDESVFRFIAFTVWSKREEIKRTYYETVTDWRKDWVRTAVLVNKRDTPYIIPPEIKDREQIEEITKCLRTISRFRTLSPSKQNHRERQKLQKELRIIELKTKRDDRFKELPLTMAYRTLRDFVATVAGVRASNRVSAARNISKEVPSSVTSMDRR